jgi:transmembrane sensor
MVNILIDNKSGLPPARSVRAEAAVWLSRLHSDERTEQTERAFRRWLAASPAHRAAFEQMTGVWECTESLHRMPSVEVSQAREFGRALRRTLVASAVTLALCALLTAGALYLIHWRADARSEVFVTTVGERRLVVLADGTRLDLNTDSRVKVTYGSHIRRVTLEKGQARFDVVRNPSRPFVVRVGEEQIVALGTAFDVRSIDGRISIVLVEGSVAVLPAGDSYTSAGSPSALTLNPGERLDFESPTFAVKSTIRLDREEAWVKGRVVFDATRLGAAVAEINRYASRRLELVNPALGDLLISGTFSVDDPNAFARAVAQMFSLQVIEAPNSVLIGSSSR